MLERNFMLLDQLLMKMNKCADGACNEKEQNYYGLVAQVARDFNDVLESHENEEAWSDFDLINLVSMKVLFHDLKDREGYRYYLKYVMKLMLEEASEMSQLDLLDYFNKIYAVEFDLPKVESLEGLQFEDLNKDYYDEALIEIQNDPIYDDFEMDEEISEERMERYVSHLISQICADYNIEVA